MRFTKDFDLSVRCVRCGAKLDCVLEDGEEKYDFVVVVDGHNCVGGRTLLAPDVCPECAGSGVTGSIGLPHQCPFCGGTGKRR